MHFAGYRDFLKNIHYTYQNGCLYKKEREWKGKEGEKKYVFLKAKTRAL